MIPDSWNVFRITGPSWRRPLTKGKTWENKNKNKTKQTTNKQQQQK